MGACYSSSQALDELRILLIGKTGVGKSTTGNMILNENVFKTSNTSNSVTTRCQWGKRLLRKRWQSVMVVDTPGLFGTDMSVDETRNEISLFTGLISPGPHVIILVLKIGQKYTPEERVTVESFVKMFGEDIYKHMIILFTCRSILEEENVSFEDYLKTLDKHLQDVIRRADNRCIAFGIGKDAKKRKDAEQLFKLINSTISRNGTYYSNETFLKIEEANRIIIEQMKREAKEPYSDKELVTQLREDYENQGPWYERLLDLLSQLWSAVVEKALSVGIPLLVEAINPAPPR